MLMQNAIFYVIDKYTKVIKIRIKDKLRILQRQTDSESV